MLEKDSRYSFSRLWLAVIAVTSLLTAFLTMLRVENGFFFTAFVPTEVALQNIYGLNSFFNDTVFFVLCFLVILLYYVVYVMSKNSKKWLLTGFFLYLADTACMVYYIWRAGFNQAWILELVAHVVILGFLLYGYFRAGKLERLERENAIMKVDRKYLMEFEVSDD